MMPRKLLVPLLLLAVQFLVGCSSAPKYSEMTLPPIPAGQGRLVIFRDGFPLGFAVQPDVSVNGQVVGKSVPNNFFFVDRAPGQQNVACMTEWRHDTNIELPAGQTLFVQTHIAPGVLVGQVWPELVPAEKAQGIVKDCNYNGPPLKPQGAGS